MGKFILTRLQGQYAFQFLANNGDLVMTSQSHITKSAAQQALNDTRKCSTSAHLYQKKEDGGQHYFVVLNESGQVLAASVKFWSAESRDYAITIVRREAEEAGYSETV